MSWSLSVCLGEYREECGGCYVEATGSCLFNNVSILSHFLTLTPSVNGFPELPVNLCRLCRERLLVLNDRFPRHASVVIKMYLKWTTT